MSEPDKAKTRLPKILLVSGLVLLLAVVAATAAVFLRPDKGAKEEAVAEQASQDASDTAPQNQWIDWSEGQEVSAYKIAGFDIQMSAVPEDGLRVPVMTVTAAGGEKTQIKGEAASNKASARFAVVQMDADSPDRQVLFSSFSNGAHCCTVGYVLDFEGNGWRTIEMGAWDGDELPLPRDVDGDGRKEFVLSDQRFLYAFAPYADSEAPTAIYAVRNGRFEDISAEPKFRPLYTRELASLRQGCARGGNGVCAGYVATAARAGQLSAAWPVMLRTNWEEYDWTYPAPCLQRGATDCDADDQRRFETYPESLLWFLGETGYAPKVFEKRNAGAGPSFSCQAARTAAERLICSSPALREIDVDMAEAYFRAQALSGDWAGLRRSQNDFLRDRNAITDPKLMMLAYQDRIDQLDVD